MKYNCLMVSYLVSSHKRVEVQQRCAYCGILYFITQRVIYSHLMGQSHLTLLYSVSCYITLVHPLARVIFSMLLYNT